METRGGIGVVSGSRNIDPRILLWEGREELWAALSERWEEEGVEKPNIAQIPHTSGASQTRSDFYRWQIR